MQLLSYATVMAILCITQMIFGTLASPLPNNNNNNNNNNSSSGIFTNNDNNSTQNPDQVVPNNRLSIIDQFLPGIVDQFLPSIIEVIARQAIPQISVDLGGSLMPQNSTWVQLNGWIIGVSIALSFIIFFVLGLTVYIVRKRLQNAKEAADCDDEDSDEDNNTEIDDESLDEGNRNEGERYISNDDDVMVSELDEIRREENPLTSQGGQQLQQSQEQNQRSFNYNVGGYSNNNQWQRRQQGI